MSCRGGFRDNFCRPTKKCDTKPALPPAHPTEKSIHWDVLWDAIATTMGDRIYVWCNQLG
ncbi:hypothetical protein [Allocoleopsis sp.]|uniref:hypothetical protein n=1 Tax=Allocoleopsis sp. TaxID=3088169 RepID=UPI002FD40F5B